MPYMVIAGCLAGLGVMLLAALLVRGGKGLR
jgi:hypothetical protein